MHFYFRGNKKRRLINNFTVSTQVYGVFPLRNCETDKKYLLKILIESKFLVCSKQPFA